MLTSFTSLHSASYQVTDLDTLGSVYSEALGINDSGQVVGRVLRDGYWNAFTYSDNTMTYLYPVPGTLFNASGINDNGQIVGNGKGGAFLGYDSINWSFIPVIGNSPGNIARGINDEGQVVGWRDERGVYSYHAFVYKNGSMHDLGTLGGNASDAFAINSSSQIVGWSETSTLNQHAFLSSGGSMLDLGTISGPNSTANDINETGQIVGWSDVDNGIHTHASLWQNGLILDLGTLGGNYSYAMAINDGGDVVGNSNTEDGYHAFVYVNGSIFDLNDLIDPSSGWILRDATDINNSGQIIGHGINSFGQEHAFLLTQIPEPAIPEPTTILPTCIVTLLAWRKLRRH